MRKFYFVLMFLIGGLCVNAQEISQKATSTSKAAYMIEIPALSKMDNIISAEGFEHVAPPKRRGSNTVVPGKGLPNGIDPLLQRQVNVLKSAGRAPSTSFGAHAGTVLNDPTGAIGPNHYVYAFNSGFGILDRSGNVLLPEASLATLFPNETLGDPVVVYDRYADRFIIMEFSNSPNGILIAVCQGPDPVNDGWYTYRFNTGTFPDYEKMSVWSDGYYITANKDQGSSSTSDVVFAVERDEMLIGNANSQMIGFPLPNSSNNGFYSPGGFNSIGSSLPPLGTPQPIVYMQDDSWSGVSQDHLKIWNISVDWNNAPNSSISSPQILNTSSFDSVFDNGSFQNLDEPGNGPDIDALQATMMYMTNYRRFGSHNSAVMNFVVDVTGSDSVAGIRWYELRQSADGQPWTIYQEGTYTQPNGYSAFSGSIGMDSAGNIGLAYTIVSPSVYTSLRYTGRQANDPLGTMTVSEQTIVDGDSQNNRSDGRYGDYAQLTIDPNDDMTFWHIGEYMKGPSNVRKSHVAAFKIATGPADTEAPTTPTSLSASNTTAVTTDLSWSASTDNVSVVGYDVYQDGNLVGTASGTTYAATGLTPLTSYAFYVVAKDGAGNQSGNSNTVSVTTLDVSGCTGGITAFPYSESFENTLGAWSQASGDDLNWTIDANGTPSSGTGPSSATLGTYYIYVEASGNGTGYPNKRAIINSPCYDLSAETQATFSFQYHMYGATDMGSIDLEASNDDGLTWTNIWSQTGNQGNSWLPVDVNLAAYIGSSVQLRFNRFVGNTWQADIALDNIVLSAGSGGGDTTAPVITLNGSSTINLTVGDVYTELGATALDDTDGDLTSSIVISGTVNTGTAGTYIVTYTVTDAAGNAATETRTVVVNDPIPDTTAPVITLNGSSTINLTVGDIYTELGATAVDDTDGDLTSSIVTSGTVNTGTAGTFTVTYTVTDAAGNIATETRTVIVSEISSSTVLHEGFFETGWDSWSDGGNDSFRYNGGRSYEGSYSIRLRDNTNSSTMTSPTFDLTSYDNVEVEFFFYPNSMENNEDFWLQYNSGSGWTTVASWARGTDFENNSFYTSTVTLDTSQYNFVSNARFRFRNDASGNNDRVYIDAVTITASNGAARDLKGTEAILVRRGSEPLDTHALSEADDDFAIYPNPVQTILNVKTRGLSVDDVKIFSAFGLLVNQVSNLGDSNTINVSDLATGTYFIRFISGDIIVTRKFIKN